MAKWFELDADLLCVGAEHLNLNGQISVYENHKPGPNNGICHSNLVGGLWRHKIMVKSYFGSHKANKIIWHELCHAKQIEETGDLEKYIALYRLENKAVGYNRNHFELEARALAESMSHVYLLRQKVLVEDPVNGVIQWTYA